MALVNYKLILFPDCVNSQANDIYNETIKCWSVSLLFSIPLFFYSFCLFLLFCLRLRFSRYVPTHFPRGFQSLLRRTLKYIPLS